MAWITTLTTVLPLVADLVGKGLPHFTRRKDAPDDRTEAVTQQQISELQSAATQNAASLKLLAEQLQKTVVAVEGGAEGLARQQAELREALQRWESDAARREQAAQAQAEAATKATTAARRQAAAALGIAVLALAVAVVQMLR
ncbi:hypothetical protein [Aquabacterium sp. J223]|uniref:hypothetical protein n=1 Tax=Aquabacterium sp. J223 TaxID=2898431 RepID=UPI00289A2F9E|nr:hypothetical protein [Aquabacterium sp. J223]